MDATLGVVLACACACLTNLAALCKHRGACRASAVDWRRPLASAIALWRSRWFAAGMAVGAMAWGLHVLAIAVAPLSFVQAVLAGGIVLLGVMADQVFGVPVTSRQRWGLASTAAGLTLLGLTLPEPSAEHAGFSPGAMLGFEVGLVTVGAVLLLGPCVRGLSHRHGVMLAAAAGLLFGMCNVALKALTDLAGHDGVAAAVGTPWAVLAAAASAVAFYASARSLQIGDPIAVIAITGSAANVVGITAGIVVFGDPFASDPVGVVLQCLAFVLIVVAAALTPRPGRDAACPAP